MIKLLHALTFLWLSIGVPSVCWLETDVQHRHCSFKFTHEEEGCGYYVPIGYKDQWASSVTTSGRHLTCSSNHLLLGPPPPGMKCKSTRTELSPPLWLPCQMMHGMAGADNYQLMVRYGCYLVLLNWIFINVDSFFLTFFIFFFIHKKMYLYVH